MAAKDTNSDCLEDGPIHVSLTREPLNITSTMDRVRSPKAGAIVLFAGTTRDNFKSTPVRSLSYASYAPLALRTLFDIAHTTFQKNGLTGIAIVHRLGDVPIGEESILVVVSAPHRQAAWVAGQEALEECKSSAEIWKKEEFEDGEGVWRENDNADFAKRRVSPAS